MFIDPETCPQVGMQFFSGTYPDLKYGFASPAGLCKVVARVPVFVILPVSINTFISFKEVPEILQFWLDCCRFIYKRHRRLFLLLGF